MANEAHEHLMLCTYIKTNFPDVLFTTDLSGIRVPMGTAKKLPALRSSNGIPDLLIFSPRGGYHGLMIEMKASGIKVNKKDGSIRHDEHLLEQNEVLRQLRVLGYYADFAMGFEEGKRLVDQYMALRDMTTCK